MFRTVVCGCRHFSASPNPMFMKDLRSAKPSCMSVMVKKFSSRKEPQNEDEKGQGFLSEQEVELFPSHKNKTRITIPATTKTTNDETASNSRGFSRVSSEQRTNYGLPGLGKRMKNKKMKRSGEVLFGIFPTMLALQSKRRELYALHIKESLLFSEKTQIKTILDLASAAGVSVHPSSQRDLDEMSLNRPHQGLCLDCGPLAKEKIEKLLGEENTGLQSVDGDKSSLESEDGEESSLESKDGEESSLESEDGQESSLWLYLDGIQDPMNFGAVLRTAHYFGVDKIVTTARDSCALSPVVSKASAGALEVQPVYAVAYVTAFFEAMKQNRFLIVGASSHIPATAPVYTLPSAPDSKKMVLVIGNEGSGLSQEVLQQCQSFVRVKPYQDHVPGHGDTVQSMVIDSLNVSVATGILLSHVTDKLRRPGPDNLRRPSPDTLRRPGPDGDTQDLHVPEC